MKGKTGLGLSLASCTLWAPALTVNLFKQTYLPAIQSQALRHFALYTLTNKAEQDDHCANIYHKSILYLISNALEEKTRIPWIRPDGEPILGMEKFIRQDRDLLALLAMPHTTWVLAPNDAPEDSLKASRCQRHNDFDDDPITLRSTLARILQTGSPEAEFVFPPSASSLRQQRTQLERTS
jgi:hypothetical protein